MKEIIMTRK